jgi:hypothetical protein
VDEAARCLATFSKKTIGLDELEKLLTPFFQSYDAFADRVLQLEKENVLVMVRSTGRTTRTPALALKYRINKSALSSDYHQELQRYRATLHKAINLDGYYRADPSVWQTHLPYLFKIDQFLKTHGFPADLVPAPERSYELVEDEKWIDEKGGKELLEKIGLYARLNMIPVSDPLMFAINPLKMNDQDQYHLIVENKTTYQGLLPVLKETDCATLVYGCGKAVVKSIEQFTMQYPIDAKHHFFYFGDLDREGLSIWYSLNQKQTARPALPFYLACLKKAPAVGKGYQRSRSIAAEQFFTYFTEQQAERIRTMLHDGNYYPQEILKTRELQHIWRETDWKSLIYAKS